MAPDIPSRALNDDTSIPALGLGTYPMKGDEARTAVASALEMGYRLIDTAAMYGNEAEVGQGFKASDIDPAEVVIQTKLPVGYYGSDRTVANVRAAAKRLGVERIDIMLIHWPLPAWPAYRDQWRGLVKAREEGLVRSIGVSNFQEWHLRRIIDDTGVVPVVNQIQVNPGHTARKPLLDNARYNIATQAWSPLGGRKSFRDSPPVERASSLLGVTPTQVILRWHLQRHCIPLPKASSPAHQKANLDVFGFTLSAEETAAIGVVR